MAAFCNSSSHKADHGALMRFASHPDRYPEIAGAVKAGGQRLREALARLIVAREELAKTGQDPRNAGAEVEAIVVKELRNVQEINFLGEFLYEEQILKELNFDKTAAAQLIKRREAQGLSRGFVICPNNGLRKFWWATKQETKVGNFVCISGFLSTELNSIAAFYHAYCSG